jgi:hypothetical protein
MKTLTSAAVYGLVPVPPMPDTRASGRNDNRQHPAEDVNFSQLEWLQPNAATERIATKDELARIRRELRDASAELSGGRGSLQQSAQGAASARIAEAIPNSALPRPLFRVNP